MAAGACSIFWPPSTCLGAHLPVITPHFDQSVQRRLRRFSVLQGRRGRLAAQDRATEALEEHRSPPRWTGEEDQGERDPPCPTSAPPRPSSARSSRIACGCRVTRSDVPMVAQESRDKLQSP